MSKWIYAFADIMARPISFAALTGAVILAVTIGSVLPVPEFYWTTVNISISVITMVIGQAVLVSSRRDGMALHLKLDRIIEAEPTDNEAIGVEHEEVEIIKAAKVEVEERTQDRPIRQRRRRPRSLS